MELWMIQGMEVNLKKEDIGLQNKCGFENSPKCSRCFFNIRCYPVCNIYGNPSVNAWKVLKGNLGPVHLIGLGWCYFLFHSDKITLSSGRNKIGKNKVNKNNDIHTFIIAKYMLTTFENHYYNMYERHAIHLVKYNFVCIRS